MQCPKCKSSDHLVSSQSADGDKIVTTFKCLAPQHEIFNRRGDPVVDDDGNPVPVTDDDGNPVICNTTWTV